MFLLCIEDPHKPFRYRYLTCLLLEYCKWHQEMIDFIEYSICTLLLSPCARRCQSLRPPSPVLQPGHPVQTSFLYLE